MSKKTTRVIGLMSGTSLDGVDLAEIEFTIIRKKVKYRIVKAKTFSYPAVLSAKIKRSKSLSGLELILLDRELGRFYGDLILKFCGENLPDLISSHGHTVFHQTQNKLTCQIGSGAEIAAVTGVKTICDFRSTDVALGGQGAPLVPFGDALLFSEYDYCLNLGGYSNISFEQKNSRLAFDVSVCNVLLNDLARLSKKSYDDKGKMASAGKMNASLFKALNKIEFYHRTKNISLGNEWYEKEVWPLFSSNKISIEDKLHTATEHIAYQISKVIKDSSTVLVTGGGAYNDYLMGRIGSLSDAKLIKPDKSLIEFKEALIFALLGYMREKEWVNTFSSYTGAIRNSSGGAIYHP